MDADVWWMCAGNAWWMCARDVFSGCVQEIYMVGVRVYGVERLFVM